MIILEGNSTSKKPTIFHASSQYLFSRLNQDRSKH